MVQAVKAVYTKGTTVYCIMWSVPIKIESAANHFRSSYDMGDAYISHLKKDYALQSNLCTF